MAALSRCYRLCETGFKVLGFDFVLVGLGFRASGLGFRGFDSHTRTMQARLHAVSLLCYCRDRFRGLGV